MKRRTVFIFDNGDRSVRISREVGRSADDGLQPDSGPERIQRQRIPGVAAGKKRVKALSIRRPVDFGGEIVHLPMILASSAAIIIMPFFSWTSPVTVTVWPRSGTTLALFLATRPPVN